MIFRRPAPDQVPDAAASRIERESHLHRHLPVHDLAVLDDAQRRLAELARTRSGAAWEKAFVGPQHMIAGSLRIAECVPTGELAAARMDFPAVIAALGQGVALEDRQACYEPPVWHQPLRQTLGADTPFMKQAL